MNFDQLGPSWRNENQTAEGEATSARRQLEQHVAPARTIERFTAQVFRRDVVETIACLLVIYWFGSYLLDRELLARFAMPAVAASGMVVIILGAFYVMYRLQRTRLSTPVTRLDAPVREFFDNEIVRVEKQIDLLNSVLLWYLGPFYVGVNLIFFSVEGSCAEVFVVATIVTHLFWVIYRLNRLVASGAMTLMRDRLVWQREQLDFPESQTPEPPDASVCVPALRRFAFRVFCSALAVGVGGLVLLWALDNLKTEYPKLSPFDAVRWRATTPEVRVGEEWYRLISIDGVPTKKIIDFCSRTYGQHQLRKRFEEDLVEVLTRMNHKPGDTVRLVVARPGSADEVDLEAVPMSEQKRWAIKRAAMVPEGTAPPPPDASE